MAEADSGDLTKRYEFDAPSHVVSLMDLQHADNDDKWFDLQAEETAGHLITPTRPDWPFSRGENHNLPRAVVNPQVKTDTDAAHTTQNSPPPNLVTSWGTESPRRIFNNLATEPRRVSKRRETSRIAAQQSAAQQSAAAPPAKKYKKSPASRPARKSNSVHGKSGNLNSRARSEQPSARMAPTTEATASNTEPCSSEELELERIRNLQKEVAMHRKKNEASYKAALAGNPPPKKKVLSTTIPKDFHFNTDARLKASSLSSTSHKEVDFASQLRKPASPARAVRGATVPKPFNLSTGNKRKLEEPEPYVPLAQRIEQFQKRTPERYHLRSRQSQGRGPSPVKVDHLKLTQPRTPNLMTRQRRRQPAVKSSAELEAEEVEKLQNFKFKALELNKKILESAEELKKPPVREPTVPDGFELQIEKRLQERQATKKPHEDEEVLQFKSRPLPKKILEGVVGLPEKKVLLATIPESPAFALKNRIRVEHKVEEVKQPAPLKVHPVPHYGLPFQPQLPEQHHVEVCPFSFEERERERRALKEKQLEEKQNEEVPQFKAQPLPDFNAMVLPEKKKLEPTKPEPFRLRTDHRGAVKASRLEHMLKEEQRQMEEAAVFKARPNTVTHKEPFQPKKEARAALAVEAFELATERRARERLEYEQLASEKEARRALMEEEQRREEEEKDKEEIARLRQEQVHRAHPIRHYKPVAVKKSEIPLTVPQSPNFSDRFRL